MDTAALLSSSSATLQEGGKLLMTHCTGLVLQECREGHALAVLKTRVFTVLLNTLRNNLNKVHTI